ncbi:hypothetical protein [Rhizobium grahamii]|uniref:Uncharacterized protein n=1 Tax=Rhizobium grahamii TaxID=1120045 RepID=A0A370KHD1_9HYPH|nr:hypothetical protein [Rhizobium grahamii]RDJ04517.1 hypothetical protein B5K06_27170 [Rhizobium grahamii]
MTTNEQSRLREATKHTAVIGTVVQMWEKLAWDIDVFEDIQRSYPNEKQPLAYAAINICIAAGSLRDWVIEAIRSLAPAGSEPSKDNVRDQLALQIPQLNMCTAIANTAKHHNFKEGRWVGGRVELGWEEGDEDIPSGFALYHVDNDGQSMTLAFSSFRALKEAWWNALDAEGLAAGRMPTPEWMRNKLARIFRPIVEKLPR